ncbi:plasmid mobilization relaxosome protein MobC [Mucilaginibacter sp. CAU 1740]|uniref:plasmid mobilization protein n=1 Tax=Mucilaginibacter sp. CAU 1740 TaxID=3140365 RepID=UPI00325BFFC6
MPQRENALDCLFCNRQGVPLSDNNGKRAPFSEVGALDLWVLWIEFVETFCVGDDVMTEENTGRKHRITLRLTGDEYSELDKQWKNSTVRKLSELVRRLIFGRKFTVYTRNKSLDDLLEELALLRRELNAIGVNFNQAVHRLNMLDHAPQMQVWLARFEQDKERYFAAVAAIELRLKTLADEWLR